MSATELFGPPLYTLRLAKTVKMLVSQSADKNCIIKVSTLESPALDKVTGNELQALETIRTKPLISFTALRGVERLVRRDCHPTPWQSQLALYAHLI